MLRRASLILGACGGALSSDFNSFGPKGERERERPKLKWGSCQAQAFARRKRGARDFVLYADWLARTAGLWAAVRVRLLSQFCAGISNKGKTIKDVPITNAK
jgi:hypothetical protein